VIFIYEINTDLKFPKYRSDIHGRIIIKIIMTYHISDRIQCSCSD